MYPHSHVMIRLMASASAPISVDIVTEVCTARARSANAAGGG
jgi:hypothetical protein